MFSKLDSLLNEQQDVWVRTRFSKSILLRARVQRSQLGRTVRMWAWRVHKSHLQSKPHIIYDTLNLRCIEFKQTLSVLALNVGRIRAMQDDFWGLNTTHFNVGSCRKNKALFSRFSQCIQIKKLYNPIFADFRLMTSIVKYTRFRIRSINNILPLAASQTKTS